MHAGRLLVVAGMWAACLTAPTLADETAPDAGESAPAITVVPPASGYEPPIAGPSDEARQAIGGFQPAAGLKIELFAAEPLLANPVAFCFDEQGRCYVAETYRQEKGVEDNRRHMVWLDDDIAARTVEDRLAYFKKHLGDGVQAYAVEHDRIRLLVDRNGDGRADHSTVFADGFNDILDGTGAGVLARNGDVYYTCIPKLWKLRDQNGDGTADRREALHHGYGVHVAFRGHDSHGLIFGPDGRLYFSIGDRGLNVRTDERHLMLPDTGAVLRCQPDGSELEIFAYGLRNPQELAFDEYGNLFTADNNSDSGDRARWVHVVEGGDSGWLMSYQYFPDRGPWNQERLWHPQHPGQAAYIIPPVANLADGPSGLAYYPGTGFGSRLDRTFLLCDFRGNAVNSGVHAIRLSPRGASYQIEDQRQFVGSMLATDVGFGPDGSVYVSDWVNGWLGLGKGRIYRVFDPQERGAAVSKQVQTLIAEGFQRRSADELLALLSHADQRVRQGVQFALAERGPAVVPALQQLAAAPAPEQGENRLPQLARIHAIWALGQIGRSLPAALEPVVKLVDDDDPQIRVQAARVLGDARLPSALEPLVRRVNDSQPTVQMAAALALAKTAPRGHAGALEAARQLLRENADRDPYLRHAGVMVLATVADAAYLTSTIEAGADSVRLAACLALRRQRDPEVARFLNDRDPLIVAEAARAINDDLLAPGLPALAAKTANPGLPDSIIRRALNANFRLGEASQAAAVARLAADDRAAPAMRVEALQMLGAWAKPAGRDRIVGLWRPLEERPVELVQEAVRPALAGMFVGTAEVRQEAARLVSQLQLGDAGPLLRALATDRQAPAAARVDALSALTNLKDAELRTIATQSLEDPHPRVRAEARNAVAAVDPESAAPLLAAASEAGEQVERQQALAALGQLPTPAADAILRQWLGRLQAKQVPAELQLDVLEAAGKRSSSEIRQQLAAYLSSRPADDPLAPFRETLYGGDAARGQTIFFEQLNVACRRCHLVGGKGGGIGPDLSRIGAEKTREYLLEAIVAPDRTIAKNFESVVLVLDDGLVVTGILKREDERELHLQTMQGNFVTVDKSRIEDRGRGKSAMPEDLVKYLSRSDLRDLVEYLSTLK